jgi:anti-anti-sigma factor
MDMSSRRRRTLCQVPLSPLEGDGSSEFLLTVVAPEWPDRDAPQSSSLVLILAGELCAYSSPLVRDVVIEAGSRTRHLVLDMRDVCFCDAAGVHLLVEVCRALIVTGGRVSLRPVNRSVLRVLALCRAEELFFGSEVDLAPARLSGVPAHQEFVITNRDQGQVIDVLLRDELSEHELIDVERRLVHLVRLRQPCDLRVELPSALDRRARPRFEQLAEALDAIGGVLTITSGRLDPVAAGR